MDVARSLTQKCLKVMSCSTDNLLLLSAFPIRGRHSGFSFSCCFYLLYPPLSLQHQPCPLSPHPSTSFFGLPCFFFPGNSILSILLPIYSSSFLRRCPYRLSCFLSKPSNLCSPSDVLIPDLVHSCHS